MKKMQQARWMSALVLPAILSLTACSKDADYDNLLESDGIDLTMQLNAGLKLPLGSTEKLMLTELLDSASVDVLKIDQDGVYRIVKDGEIDNTSFRVNSTEISVKPEITEQSFDFDVPADKNITGENKEYILQAINEATPGTTFDVVINNAIALAMDKESLKQYNKIVDDSYNASYTTIKTLNPTWTDEQIRNYVVEQLASGGVTAASVRAAITLSETDNVVTVKYEGNEIAKMEKPTQFVTRCDNLVFQTTTAIPMEAENVDKGLVDVLGITLAAANVKVSLNVSGMPLVNNAVNPNILLKDVKLAFPYFIQLDNATGCVIEKGSNTVNVAQAQFPIVDGKANYDLQFDLIGIELNEADKMVNHVPEGADKGTLSHDNSAQDKIYLSGEAETEPLEIPFTEIVVTDDHGLSLKNQITVAPAISPINTAITKVKGHFDPKVDPINTTVDLNITDDFLKHDLTLDLLDPAINLDLNCATTVTVLADVTITPVGEGINVEPIVFKTVRLEAGQAVHHVVLNKSQVKSGNLQKILDPMPEKLQIDVVARTDKDNLYDFALGQDIQVSGKYGVDAALSFSDIKINRTEKAENVFGSNRSDAEDIAKKLPNGIDGAHLTMTVTNAVPVDLKITLEAVNWEGEVEEGNVTVSNIVVGKGDLSAPTTTKVDATVTIRDLAKLKDLNIVLSGAGQNGSFNARQYVKMDDIMLTLPKLTLDLND